jgi:hypothetical protein
MNISLPGILAMVIVLVILVPAFSLERVPTTDTGVVVAVKVHKTKVPFAVKHPKLHNFGRGLRKKTQLTANILAPYFQILGGLFQTALYFKR